MCLHVEVKFATATASLRAGGASDTRLTNVWGHLCVSHQLASLPVVSNDVLTKRHHGSQGRTSALSADALGYDTLLLSALSDKTKWPV